VETDGAKVRNVKSPQSCRVISVVWDICTEGMESYLLCRGDPDWLKPLVDSGAGSQRGVGSDPLLPPLNLFMSFYFEIVTFI